MPSSGFVEKSSLYSCLARNRLHETPSTLAFYLERTPRNVESWDASFRFDTLLWVDPYVRTARWLRAARVIRPCHTPVSRARSLAGTTLSSMTHSRL